MARGRTKKQTDVSMTAADVFSHENSCIMSATMVLLLCRSAKTTNNLLAIRNPITVQGDAIPSHKHFSRRDVTNDSYNVSVVEVT